MADFDKIFDVAKNTAVTVEYRRENDTRTVIGTVVVVNDIGITINSNGAHYLFPWASVVHVRDGQGHHEPAKPANPPIAPMKL